MLYDLLPQLLVGRYQFGGTLGHLLFQTTYQRAETCRHSVEAVSKLTNLIGAVNPSTGLQVASSQFTGGFRQLHHIVGNAIVQPASDHTPQRQSYQRGCYQYACD